MNLDALERLTQGGVSFRYPGVDATPADVDFAIDLARRIRAELGGWLAALAEAPG